MIRTTLILVLVLGFSPHARGQSLSTGIRGTVKDPSGTVVANEFGQIPVFIRGFCASTT